MAVASKIHGHLKVFTLRDDARETNNNGIYMVIQMCMSAIFLFILSDEDISLDY